MKKTIANALDALGWIAFAGLAARMLVGYFADPARAFVTMCVAWAASWALRRGVVWWKRRGPRRRARVARFCDACGYADHAPCAACPGR